MKSLIAWMQSKREIFKKIILFIICLFIIFQVWQFPVMAQEESSCSLAQQESWRNKFPMGFVVGTPPASDLLEECPTFELFTYSYPVCAIGQLLGILKNVFLIKFILSSIQNL